MEITLESLGIDKAQITDMLLDRLVEEFTTEVVWDEDGEKGRKQSKMARKLTDQITSHIDETVTRLGNEHVLPKVTEIVEGMVIQKTNQWGEKTGTPTTFIEYLTSRADAYMREDVDFDGKSKGSDNYNWRKSTTRIAYMVDKHLQYSIESAMKKALADANSAITEGIAEAVKIKLAEVQAKIKVGVTTK